MTRSSNSDGLPRGLYLRGAKISISYTDEHGKARARTSGFGPEDADKAVLLRNAILRKIEARKAGAGPGTHDRNSLKAVAAWWIDLRERRGRETWKDDETRLRLHVLPTLGHRGIESISPSDLEEVFLSLRVTPLESTGKPPAPKTVWNTYTALKALYRDARKKGRAKNDPCILTEEELGPIEDADPDWRAGAIFSRSECAALMFDPRLPDERRPVYATMYLTGVRIGELCGLRVSDFDRKRRPLAALGIARQYSGRRTKTRTTKEMPVHAVLFEALSAWLDETWPALYGRKPEPADLIFPRLPSDAPSKKGPVRDKNYERRRRDADLKTLGLAARRGHDFRASFITHALDDGADRAVLERLTHPSSAKGSAFEGYRRLQWDEACRAVTSLEVEVPVDSTVTLAAGDDTDPGDEGGGTSTPSSGHSSSTPTGQTGARLSNHDSNHDTKRKPLEIPGVLEWRRRESNPGPEALKQDIYVCSHQYFPLKT